MSAYEKSQSPQSPLIRWDGSLANRADTRRLSAYIAAGLLALSAGSGELYGWPRLASLEGTRVLWLLLPAALFQIPVLAECQRAALLTGRSFFALAGAASPFWGIVSILCTLVSFLWLGGWLTGSAAMIAILIGVPAANIKLATNILAVVLAILLGWPLLTKRLLARYVSIVLKIFAVATFLAALLSLFLLPDRFQTLTHYIGEMFRPHFDVFTIRRGATDVDLILAITFLGLGSWASVLYTGYASLERYGRTSSGDLWRNPNDGEDSGAPGALSLLSNWREDLRQWYRHTYADTSIGIVLNLVSTGLLTFLSVRLLYASGLKIGRDYDLLSQQARFFEPLLGQFAVPAFILIGSAFLLDTWIGFVPLMAKGFQEGLQTSIPGLRRIGEESLYRWILLVLAIQTILTAMVTAPGNLIRLTAICLNVTHPIVIALLLYLNYIYLPRLYGKAIRPGVWALVSLCVAFIGYTLLAVWYLIRILS